MSSFEDRLWSELVRAHGDAMRAATLTAPIAGRAHRSRTRRPALLTGTAVGSAGLVTAITLAVSVSGSAPAFAVTGNPDGTVTVTLRQISAVKELNATLARARINARAVPLTASCPTGGVPRYMPAGTNPSTYKITIVPRQIPAGYTGVLAARQDAAGRVELMMGSVPSPAPRCFNAKVPVFREVGVGTLPAAERARIERALKAARMAARR